jgi:hypothetical protein
MFNNFRTHPLERHALGVRVINTRPEAEYEPYKFWWFCALHFGGCPSPYITCQSQQLILEYAKGDRHNLKNPWQWEPVQLNLPGDFDYDLSMPQVMLLRGDGELATQEANYVNDIHPCIREREGSSKGWLACAQLKSKMNSFGIRRTIGSIGSQLSLLVPGLGGTDSHGYSISKDVDHY